MRNSINEKKKEKEKEKEKEPIKIPQLSYNFNISDIIVKYIIEKIISLTITQSLKNKIERQINSYCFEQIENSLLLALYIDFINYDKDDMTHKKTLLDFKSHSKKDILEEKEEKNLIKNKSEILRKYKFCSKLDANISFEESINLEVFKTPKKEKEKEKLKESNNNKKYFMRFIKEEKKELKEEKIRDPNLGKLLDGLILRESYKDKENNKYDILMSKKISNKNSSLLKESKEPFTEDIEHIKNLESHKLDFNPELNFNKKLSTIMINDTKINKNSWINIQQPNVPPIDRDAGTKINYIKNPLNKFKKMKTIKDPEEELLSSNQAEKKEIIVPKSPISKKNKIYYPKKNKVETEDDNPRRKKYAPLIEFPSYDIDPKVLGGDTESEELKQLRENLEKELIEKKLEQAKKLQKEREIQALEKAREEKRKELANKNVTVDIKGDIVYIKSLNINDFTNDFTKMRAKFKEIKTIQTSSKTALIQKAVVEKNPIIIYEQEAKEKSKKKGKRNYYLKSPKKDDRQQGNNRNLGLVDRLKDPILAAGSNFEIMKPECGVSLKEDEKTKFGGKDFYSKYNKYSIEVFEETLNKTINSNFYSMQRTSIIPNNINNSNTGISRNLKKLKSKKIKEENQTEANNNENNKNLNLNLIIPNEMNNKLQVKAKNLKMALNGLDLIKEHEEKYFSAKKKNKNIIKKNKELSNYFNKNRNNFDEINKFAKTLVGSDNWGNNIYNQKRQQSYFKRPAKPLDIELKRELPLNLLNHLPRKRLPPINLSNRMNNDYGPGMGYTMTEGFFGRKKKMKILLTEDNKKKKDENDNKNDDKDKDKEDNNKDKFSYTSATGFFQKQLDE